MRRSELLIKQVRRATENEEFSNQTGIVDEEILQYLNDAQDGIYSIIQSQFPSMFIKEKETDVNAQTESVSLPADVYNESRLSKVEFSKSGQARDYYKLDSGFTDERLNGNAATPDFYIRRGREILLQPKSQSTGKVRFEYQRNLQRMDKRRGKVSAVTLDPVTLTITSLTIDTSTITNEDIEEIQNLEFGCIVNRLGVIQMARLPIESIDINSGVVSFFSGFTYESTETITVGDYLVGGYYSSSHSELPDTCERFLISYSQKRVLSRDSSNDAGDAKSDMEEMRADIISAFAQPSGDINEVPVTDYDYLDFY